jgi:hypothetical protein
MTTAIVESYGTALICDVLTAYRRDLERTPDVVRFGDDDAHWLRVALQVERLAEPVTGRVKRESPLARHSALRPQRLLALTERMEAAGALTLAFTTLAAARRVWDSADPASAGVAIWRQARICRESGATPAAENFYTYLYGFATRHRLPHLRARALIGRGVIRTLEGDPAAGRRWFVKARAAAGGNPLAIGVSYHAEMVAALAEGDHSQALVSGWKALSTGALENYDEAGVMTNLASIALQAGHPLAAMRAVHHALRKSSHPRVRLTAYSKGALAAAQLGRKAMVEKFAARLVTTAASANFPVDELESRSELAVAFAHVGETAKARRLARSVRRHAFQLGLGVVVRRCDAVLARETIAEEIVELSAPAQRVVLELQAA